MLVTEIERAQIFMNKSIYLGLAKLISKIVLYDFWYNHLQPKYEEKAKLCYMDTDSYIIYIKVEDIYLDFAALRRKTYSYLRHDNNENKNGKGTKKCILNKNLNFRIINIV